MRCLVTGGTGFIGNALVHKLLALGHKVFFTGRNNEQHTETPCISYTFHDIDWKTISPIDAVFHQAAITNTTHKPDSDFYFVNVQNSKTLFYDAARNGCTHFIYASSCAVYGNNSAPFKEEDASPETPINAYGASKILFDEWAIPWSKEQGIIAVGLRYSNVYGNGEEHKGKSSSMIYQLMQQMQNGRPKLFKWGEQKRDFVHVNDVIAANLLAWEAKESGVYNTGSGIPTSFNHIVEILNKVLGTKLEPEYFDNPYEGFYQDYTCCDITHASSIGYKPRVSIEEGIRSYTQSQMGIK